MKTWIRGLRGGISLGFLGSLAGAGITSLWTLGSMLLAVLGWPSSVVMGQDQTEATSVHSFYLIAGSPTPDAFLFPECSDGATIGVAARLSRLLSRRVSVALEVPFLVDPRAGACTYDYAGPPWPYNWVEEKSRGQPNFAPSLRFSVGSDAAGGFGGWSVEAGSGYAVDARTPFWLLGFSLRFGRESGKQLVLGWETWFMDVRLKSTYRQMDGADIVLQETVSRKEAERMHFLRIGLRMPTK